MVGSAAAGMLAGPTEFMAPHSMSSELQTHILQCPANARAVEQALDAQGLACRLLREAHDCHRAPACRWLRDAPLGEQAHLVAALDEVIEVLQRTRHAFKSKELGQLRRRLETLLQGLASD